MLAKVESKVDFVGKGLNMVESKVGSSSFICPVFLICLKIV